MDIPGILLRVLGDKFRLDGATGHDSIYSMKLNSMYLLLLVSGSGVRWEQAPYMYITWKKIHALIGPFPGPFFHVVAQKVPIHILPMYTMVLDQWHES